MEVWIAHNQLVQKDVRMVSVGLTMRWQLVCVRSDLKDQHAQKRLVMMNATQTEANAMTEVVSAPLV
jgi:hypothetical protein